MTEIRGQRSVVIQRPVNEVFEYISDFSRHKEWNYQILEITKLTDGPLGVGTMLRARERAPRSFPFMMKLVFPIMARLMGMQDSTEAEITEWEPENKIGWKASASFRNGDVGVKSQWMIEFEGQNGATRVTQHYHYVPIHEKSKKMMSDEQKMIGMIDEEIDRNLAHLKEILEARASRQVPREEAREQAPAEKVS